MPFIRLSVDGFGLADNGYVLGGHIECMCDLTSHGANCYSMRSEYLHILGTFSYFDIVVGNFSYRKLEYSHLGFL